MVTVTKRIKPVMHIYIFIAGITQTFTIFNTDRHFFIEKWGCVLASSFSIVIAVVMFVWLCPRAGSSHC